MEQLVGVLSQDNCPVVNLFIDWNPIYKDDYTGGYIEDNKDCLFTPDEESEPPVTSIWASLVEKAKKVQVLFLRHSGLTDADLKQMCTLLKPEAGPLQNKVLKVLDISYNNFDNCLLS